MPSVFADGTWAALERRLLRERVDRDTARLTTMSGPQWAALLRLERRINRGWRLLAALEATAPPEGRGR